MLGNLHVPHPVRFIMAALREESDHGYSDLLAKINTDGDHFRCHSFARVREFFALSLRTRNVVNVYLCFVALTTFFYFSRTRHRFIVGLWPIFGLFTPVILSINFFSAIMATHFLPAI